MPQFSKAEPGAPELYSNPYGSTPLSHSVSTALATLHCHCDRKSTELPYVGFEVAPRTPELPWSIARGANAL